MNKKLVVLEGATLAGLLAAFAIIDLLDDKFGLWLAVTISIALFIPFSIFMSKRYAKIKRDK